MRPVARKSKHKRKSFPAISREVFVSPKWRSHFGEDCAPSLCPAQAPSTAVPPRKECFRQRRKRPAPSAKPPDTITVRGAAAPPTPPGFCKKQQLGDRCGGRAITDRPYNLHSQGALRLMRLSTSSVAAATASPQGEAKVWPCISLPLEGKVAEGRMRWNAASPASRRARCAP